MPQPAFSVRPASCTLPRMSSIESRIVPDTVQLIVDVAGLCSCAPAFEVMRPAGMAPRRSAHRNCSYQCSRDLGQLRRRRAPGRRAGRCRPSTVDRRAVLGGQAVLLVPDVERRFLERDAARVSGIRISRRCSLRRHGSPAHGGCRLMERPGPARRRLAQAGQRRIPALTPACGLLGTLLEPPEGRSCRTQHVGSGEQDYAPSERPSTAVFIAFAARG